MLTSALAETFLRKLNKQKFIKYYEGTDRFDLAEDQVGFHVVDSKGIWIGLLL